MRFARVGSSGLSSLFVPVLYPVQPSRASSPVEDTRSTSLDAKLDASESHTSGKWPWVFKHPGRCVDLPAEEVFSGFDGLLLDDVSDSDSQDDQAYSKVRVSPLCSRNSRRVPRYSLQVCVL